MIIIMLLCCLPSEGGLVPFSPVVRGFSPSDYNGGRQNWSVTQSEPGMIYVGNSQYLLEYDGHSWNRFPMPGKGVVRSVLADPDGRIYCGSFKEFGYFEKSGDSLLYHSVSDGLKDKEEDLSEVWNIIRDPLTGDIVFQTFNNLYIYDGAAVKCLDGVSPLNIIKTRNGIYSQLIDGDFVRLLDGGEMYLATNHAVYTYNGQGLTLVAGLNEQVWCLGKIGGEVVCGHNNGTYSIKNGRSPLISEKGSGTFCIKEDSYNGEGFWKAAENCRPATLTASSRCSSRDHRSSRCRA